MADGQAAIDLPQQLCRTVARDCGKDLSPQATFTPETGSRSSSPILTARGSAHQGEHPKGTDLSRWLADDLEVVAHILNN